jgi:hypothetical protein
MNLEEVRRHCERQIDLQRGRDPIWNSDQMLDVVSDLQRLIENQRTDPHILEQLRRLNEELTALYAENQRLMNSKLWVTYRMEDGSDIYGEYAWVTGPEFFDDTDDECRVVKETWRLVGSEVLVFNEAEPDDDDEEPPDLLPGEPGGGDRVRPDPAGGPEDSDPYTQPDTLARRPDLS